MRVGEQQSSTSHLSSSSSVSLSVINQQPNNSNAPDVLVVPNNSSSGNAEGANIGTVHSSAVTVGQVLDASNEVSANVTVETSHANLGTSRSLKNQHKSGHQQIVNLGVPHDVLLGRWRLTLDLFGRVFVDDV